MNAKCQVGHLKPHDRKFPHGSWPLFFILFTWDGRVSTAQAQTASHNRSLQSANKSEFYFHKHKYKQTSVCVLCNTSSLAMTKERVCVVCATWKKSSQSLKEKTTAALKWNNVFSSLSHFISQSVKEPQDSAVCAIPHPITLSKIYSKIRHANKNVIKKIYT